MTQSIRALFCNLSAPRTFQERGGDAKSNTPSHVALQRTTTEPQSESSWIQAIKHSKT